MGMDRLASPDAPLTFVFPETRNPAVIEAVGSPVTEGFLVSGNTNVNGASGEANLSIPISGPKGKGTIYVAARKSLGRWNYSGLVLEIERTHQRIDLLQRAAPAKAGEQPTRPSGGSDNQIRYK